MTENRDLEARVDQVERTQRRMAEEIEQLQKELRGLGVELPELNPAGRTPLSPQARLASNQRKAAKARAAKAAKKKRQEQADE